MRRFPADHPLVSERFRTYGLLAAIELVESKDGPVLFDKLGHAGGLCRDYALSHGLMMRAVRDGMDSVSTIDLYA